MRKSIILDILPLVKQFIQSTHFKFSNAIQSDILTKKIILEIYIVGGKWCFLIMRAKELQIAIAMNENYIIVIVYYSIQITIILDYKIYHMRFIGWCDSLKNFDTHGCNTYMIQVLLFDLAFIQNFILSKFMQK